MAGIQRKEIYHTFLVSMKTEIMENSMMFQRKWKIELPHDSAISILGTYLEENGNILTKNSKYYGICSSNLHNSNNMESNKMSINKGTHKHININNGMLLRNKKNEILLFIVTWMIMMVTFLSEISQRPEDKKNTLTHLCETKCWSHKRMKQNSCD